MSEKRYSQIDYDAIKNQYTIIIGNFGKKFAENEYISVHVHRPPAVTLTETPEEFHIFTGLCQKI
jgi:hypothetical protein